MPIGDNPGALWSTPKCTPQARLLAAKSLHSHKPKAAMALSLLLQLV